jgi:hypothetical protein
MSEYHVYLHGGTALRHELPEPPIRPADFESPMAGDGAVPSHLSNAIEWDTCL